MDMLERTAVIAEIARRKQISGGQLGKTAVMKLLHLLQDGLGVPLGYRFTLYNYGPYDSDVMSDIEFAESFGQISVDYLGPDQGYQIQPTNAAPPVASKSSIETLMNNFGSMNARELELRSTLLFLSREFQDARLLERLRELKPKYSLSEVQAAIAELKQKRFIRPTSGDGS
jgi:uncharacterized protein YwgA